TWLREDWRLGGEQERWGAAQRGRFGPSVRFRHDRGLRGLPEADAARIEGEREGLKRLVRHLPDRLSGRLLVRRGTDARKGPGMRMGVCWSHPPRRALYRVAGAAQR